MDDADRRDPTPWKLAGKWIFGLSFVVTGVSHFIATDFFLKVMPPYVPLPREMIWLSGVFEVALGILLLVPRTSRLAAWGLVALLVAVFPANIHVYLHRDLFPPFPFSEVVHLVRLPFQGVLIYWAYGFTRRAAPEPAR